MPVPAPGAPPGTARARAGRRAARAVLPVLLVALAATAAAPAASAADPAPTVAVLPGTVAPRVDETTEVDVLVTNPTAAPVTVTGLSVSDAPGVTAEVDDVPDAPVPPGGVATAVLSLTPDRAVDGAEVGLVLRTRAAPDGSPVQVATATVTVGTAAVAAPTLTFLVAPDALNDGQRRRATVRIDNAGGADLTGVVLTAVAGDHVRVERPGGVTNGCADAACLLCLDELAAGAGVEVALDVVAADSVRTGTQQVAVVLTASPGDGQPDVSASAAHDVALTVFGVDALSPFGIGTVFVLPGLLAVVIVLLGNAVYPRTRSLPDQADLKDLRLFPVVVAVGALVYVGAAAGLGWDLTAAMSTWRVTAMILVGSAIGLVAWIALAVGYRVVVDRKVFRLTDTPRTVLKRLRARDATLLLPGFTLGGVELVRLAPAAAGKVYAAPRIVYTYTPAAADDTDARRELARRLGRGEVEALLDAQAHGLVTLRWGATDGVRTVDETAVTGVQPLRLPVEGSGP